MGNVANPFTVKYGRPFPTAEDEENERLQRQAVEKSGVAEALSGLEQRRAGSLGVPGDPSVEPRIGELRQRLGRDADAMPSRDAILSLAAPSPGTTPGAPVRPETDAATKGERDQVDPSGQGASQRIDPGSTDQKLPTQGTGVGADMERGVAARDRDAAQAGRIRKVTKADGSVVFTNLEDDQIGPTDRIGEVSGSAGRAYVQPGGEMEAAAAIPDASQDRDPGWALRRVYGEQHKAGTLSMDPRDVSDRQRWEDQTEFRDIERELTRAQADQAIAQARLDPKEMAQIEAEGKYAGAAIEAESEARQRTEARTAYDNILAQIDDIQNSLPEGPEKKALIDRLEQRAREISNIMAGFKLDAPKVDALAALAGSFMGPTATE